jgi:hypothetical protein
METRYIPGDNPCSREIEYLPSLIPVPDWVPVVSGIKLIVPSFNGAPFHVTFPETAMRRGPLSQPTHASKPAASIKMPEITLR